MYTIDFQKEYKLNYGGVDTSFTIIVVKDSDGTPYVFKERKIEDNYYYSRDEYYVDSFEGPITEKLSIDQLMYEEDLPEGLFWSHP